MLFANYDSNKVKAVLETVEGTERKAWFEGMGINVENATSKDVSLLMNKMYNMVKEKYTIKLVPEVKFVGIKSKEEEDLWDTMLNQK